jgi:uncharacterized cysteine cluster protein YcgN (CxxCxxCC family)
MSALPEHALGHSGLTNGLWAARSLSGQDNAQTLSCDGCGRCDGHHKIVDWVENDLAVGRLPFNYVAQYHSRSGGLLSLLQS